jgi:K+-sensing histidine kinase KdpD
MLNSRAPNGVIPYLVAVGAVLVMVIVRWLLAPLLGAQLPFTTLVIAVLVAGWYGGLGPALLATGLSALLGLFLFIPPTYSLQFAGRMEILRVLLFCLTGAIAAMLGESRLRTQARAEASAVAARNAAELGRGETQRAEQEKSRAQAAAMEAEEALNQQLEVEAALRSSEARFRAMAESSPLGIYLTEPAGD